MSPLKIYGFLLICLFEGYHANGQTDSLAIRDVKPVSIKATNYSDFFSRTKTPLPVTLSTWDKKAPEKSKFYQILNEVGAAVLCSFGGRNIPAFNASKK